VSRQDPAPPAAPTVGGAGRLELVLRALAAAPMDGDTPRLVVSQAVAAIGAQGGVVCGLDGGRLALLASRGYSPEQERACGPLAVGDLSLPLTFAATTGDPVWLGSQAETRERFTKIIDLVPRPERAYAALPLRAAGALLGVLGISFHDRHTFRAEEQEFLLALADVCAVHLHQWRQLHAVSRTPTSAAELGRLVVALSGAESLDDVSRALAEEGATAAAAAFANIALLDADGLTASLVHTSTLIQDVAHRYTTIPVDDSTPLGHAMGSGREVWLRSLTDVSARYPALLADTVATGLSATVSLPLHSRDRQLIGALGLAWATPQEFADAQREEIRVVAQLAADALSRARQRDRLERTRQALDVTARRLQALQRVTAALATAVTTDDIAQVIVRDGISLLADHGVAAMVDAERHVLRTWTSSGFPAEISRAYGVVPLDSEMPIAAAVRSGAPIIAQTQHEAVTQSPATADTYVATRTRSSLVVPARVDDRPIGALGLGFTREGAIDEETVAFATTLADLMGQALLRGAQYEHHAHVAEVLQRSLLPRLPDIPGLELAAVYAPADQGAQVGGDWYDVIDLGDRRTCLVIGDVMGHDVRAAAVMGQLRAAVHCYAGIGQTPAQVLRQLDRLVDELDDIDLVTCLCAVLDASGHRLTIATAGHLPPMTSGGGVPTTSLPVPVQPPLGAGSGDYSEHTYSLAPGALLTFFTDGVVETRTHSIDDGIARLAAFLDAGAGQPLSRLLVGAVEHMAAYTRSEDDAAILLVRATGG